MKETTSSHHISIRAYQSHTNAFRPNLNLSLFTEIVHAAIDDLPSKLKTKRKASQLEDTRRAKRTRTSRGSQDHHDNDDGQSSTSGSSGFGEMEVEYPNIRTTCNKVLPDSDAVPVFQHVLEIHFDASEVESSGSRMPNASVLDIWDNEDQELQDVLVALTESLSSSKTIDLGEARFSEYEGRAVCVLSNPRYHFASEIWLFRVPSLSIDAYSNDILSPPSADLLTATRMLQDVGRVRVQASLKMVVQPQGPDSGAFPFSLQLEFTVSLVFPIILQRIPLKHSTKRSVEALQDAQRRLLRAVYLPDQVTSTAVNNPISVSSFYSIMGPAQQLPSAAAANAMQPVALLPTLLPFQCRSVGWLLEREGMSVTSDGRIVPQTTPSEFSFWEQTQEGNRTLYFNRLSGELSEVEPDTPAIFGGMLAEEPGLGKTVETIALMLLNPAPPEWNPSLSRWDPNASLDAKAVKSTLIVTPPALASQWKSELARHAPSLKVLVYDGWTKVKVPITKTDRELARFAKMELDSKPKKRKNKGKKKADDNDDDMDVDRDGTLSRSDDGEILDWCSYVHQFDVVITTYSVLRTEIHVARPAPDRPRREEALYSVSGRARSPLVLVEWKRVVMDEVQMVGGGHAAEMVSLIPRLSSLAVSGTPAKSQMSDLIHVLKFLRIDQLVGGFRLWNRLLKPGFAEEFSSFLGYYGVRTMKSSVTAELTIPQQTRYLVGIDLGKVERHVYDQALEEVLLQLGLDARGVAAFSGWQASSNLLRTSIRRLRGICTHPQVGQLQKKGDGLYKPGALKTIKAVLESMRDQNWKNMMEDWKAKIQLLIRHAQLQQKDETVVNHYQNALRTLEAAETETQKHLDELKEVLADHDAKGKALIEEAAALRQQRNEAPPELAAGDKGKGKAREKFDDREDDGGEEDPEEKGLPKTPAGDEHRTKRRAIKQRWREGCLMLHRVKFLQGDVYHVLGRAEQEDAAYQAAEKLRRELLKATEDDANKAMVILQANGKKKNFSLDGFLVDLPFLDQGGIRSSDLMEEVNTVIEEVFNEETNLLWKWRAHIMGLLTKSLNPGENEADGQEYQRTLDDQGEAETYMQAYAALLADRREALVNERTLLATHDVREKQVRQTKAAMRAAAVDDDFDIPEGLEIQPEHEVLHKELSTQRKNILLKLQGRAIKSMLIELNAISMRIINDKDPERVIIKEAVDQLRRFISDQTSLHDKLDADLALMRKAFNERILYFRQLQEISDSVAEVEWEESSAAAAIQVCQTEKNQLDAKINTTRARQRYLDNLAQNQDDGVVEEEDKTCILCRCDFARGFITHCAHVFCELCMKAWLLRKEGKTCPVCRVPIDPENVQRFTVNANVVEPPPQPVAGEPAPQSHRKINYNTIDPTLFAEIQTMETFGDFGSKIQTLVRHLSYLKLTDPGAKSIIFSAWADSLHIVERALRDNGIRCLRIDQGSKSATEKFASDPGILVLLLHGERENAGLNITCASRVFLLESVVHHSFEIQAIARIDRLGQTRPTQVYCYYAEDTIECNILDLAARKGLSLYTKENSSGTVSVSPFNQDSEQGIDDPEKRKVLQKGDFIHKVDDMLSILFPHMFEDLEYLLPPTEVTMEHGAQDVEMTDAERPQRIPRVVEVNAVAGPSRLC
ncbi:hypothetical protein GALMADRAFT_244962 [Galerina marginata CBS 339.88]|uniref:RING-type domain-containing protein n=1 Tax=Galerina marginata (strain CBS 339.88) TaxID=685588 RepID=A0A067TDN8_GALM3|nr:hypothetical protein GALMADRAFT_244962 [Galerina marginata CBS 339.88]